jgi:hypothetical protein
MLVKNHVFMGQKPTSVVGYIVGMTHGSLTTHHLLMSMGRCVMTLARHDRPLDSTIRSRGLGLCDLHT